MAAITTTTNSLILRTTYDAEFGLDPSEESVLEGFVAQPVGVTAIGNTLTLRKVAAATASKYTAVSAGGIPSSLTGTNNTEQSVTTTLSYAYVMFEIDEPALTRLVDEANYRNALRKQGAAAVNSQVDADLFGLASSLSLSESGAAINDAMYRAAIQKLATNAKNKFKIGETDVRLFVHPTHLGDVLGIDAAREFRIRGNAGTAASGQLVTTYGIRFAESGNVLSSSGVEYNPLLLKDAWAIGYNRTPSWLETQMDGIVIRMIFRAEYGYVEWFDSSGVSLTIT